MLLKEILSNKVREKSPQQKIEISRSKLEFCSFVRIAKI